MLESKTIIVFTHSALKVYVYIEICICRISPLEKMFGRRLLQLRSPSRNCPKLHLHVWPALPAGCRSPLEGAPSRPGGLRGRTRRGSKCQVVEVTSQVDVGSTFTLVWPRRVRESQEGAGGDREGESTSETIPWTSGEKPT